MGLRCPHACLWSWLLSIIYYSATSTPPVLVNCCGCYCCLENVKVIFFVLFCRSIRLPKWWVGGPLYAPFLVRLLSHTPPPQLWQTKLLFGCCVFSLNGSHIRPETSISLYFVVASYYGTPNKGTDNGDSKPNAAHLLQSHREPRSQELGGHGGCCHGDRGQNCWGIGRWWLMLVVVCFGGVWVVTCDRVA